MDAFGLSGGSGWMRAKSFVRLFPDAKEHSKTVLMHSLACAHTHVGATAVLSICEEIFALSCGMRSGSDCFVHAINWG